MRMRMSCGDKMMIDRIENGASKAYMYYNMYLVIKRKSETAVL